MNLKKRLPIGLSEFKETIEGNYYYVDKTKIIEELITSGDKVILFTRPRRFGKTLNMTMLRDFFDCTKDTKELFKNLAISHSTYFKEINQYPVLFFSFRDSKGDKQTMIQLMKLQIMEQYQKYLLVCNQLEGYNKERYKDIYNELVKEREETLGYTQNAIRFLCEIISNYYKKQVILLIDEYDTPMINAYTEGYYDEVRSFFATLFASVLKDNPYLKQGILTGIQRIAKENIFSGLNNLKINTVLSKEYNWYFGITPQEAQQMLIYYELNLNEDVKKAYDGYNFGGQDIYNPWSLVNYAASKELEPYWINTSTNAIIRQCILESKGEFREEFEKLIGNKTVSVVVNMETSFFELKNAQTLWGLLLNAGYLTISEIQKDRLKLGYRKNSLLIPNTEVSTEFARIVAAYTKIGESSLVDLFDALLNQQDIEEFKSVYKKIILRNISFYDGKENAYHMLFLGMSIYMDGYYDIKSNIETGNGRSDIIMKAVNKDYPHIIIEFKQGKDVEKLAKEAILQIKNKKYYEGLNGHIIMLGVAHNKKECEIISEEL